MAETKLIGVDEKEEALIRSEWRDFSKTLAYKRMMEYATTTDAMLVGNSKDLVMNSPIDGKKVSISGEVANFLLQRACGIGIITSYIRLYSE